jgi:hypothetical protein
VENLAANKKQHHERVSFCNDFAMNGYASLSAPRAGGVRPGGAGVLLLRDFRRAGDFLRHRPHALEAHLQKLRMRSRNQAGLGHIVIGNGNRSSLRELGYFYS